MCNSGEHNCDTRREAADGSVTVPENDPESRTDSVEIPARQWALYHDGKIRAAGWFSTERSNAVPFPEARMIISMLAFLTANPKEAKNEH